MVEDGGERKEFAPSNKKLSMVIFKHILLFTSRPESLTSIYRLDNTIHWCLHVELD